MEPCEQHQDIMVSMTKASKDIEYLVNRVDTVLDQFAEHSKESVSVRDNVTKNSDFRKTGVWMLRAIYVAIVGIVAKILFVK